MGVATAGTAKGIFLDYQRGVCIPPRNWVSSGFQWRPSPENVLPIEVSNYYFHKNNIFFSELKCYSDDYTGSQGTEAIISAVIIFV